MQLKFCIGRECGGFDGKRGMVLLISDVVLNWFNLYMLGS